MRIIFKEGRGIYIVIFFESGYVVFRMVAKLRFFTKVLRDLGYVSCDEPFANLLTQGMVLKDGSKMSKSKGNTVDPDEVLSKYGADTLRLFILFAAPPEDQLEWNSDGLEGSWRFLNRVYQMVEKRYVKEASQEGKDQILERARHSAIKQITQSFEEGYKFNTAISQMMILANAIDKYKHESTSTLNQAIETLVLLLGPFAPHMCEELWQMMSARGGSAFGGGQDYSSISRVAWPKFNEAALIQDEITYAIQINGKVRSEVKASVTATQEDLQKLVLADPNVARYLEGATIKKFIVVPKKLVSIVI